MDFPAYVPAAVRAHIASLIEGDSYEPHGWAASLVNAEESIARIDRDIETYIRRGEDDYLDSLRTQKAEAQAHRDLLAADLECLHRLGSDPRMRDAFALLTAEFTADQEWRSFIYAACAARVDFKKHRDRVKRAAELSGKISNAAKTLANLIREFSEIGLNGPDEFYSIAELLRQTDNHEMQGHNLHMWRSMRHHILGDLPIRDLPETKIVIESIDLESLANISLVHAGEKAAIAPEEVARNNLRYAWGVAPEFPELLDTVAKTSLAFSPRESGMIGAAIDSRKHSEKAAYVRAFGKLLTDSHGLILNLPIMKAMAFVATVVLNQPEIDVTYDDVRKALENYRS
jgi:hypothetical protein